MSNVHQLVVELANYEQQRRDLEDKLYDIESQYDEAHELAVLEERELDSNYVDIHYAQVDTIEAQLDFIYERMDDLQELIDEETEQSHGFHDDDF